jgi:outer membrane protein assembly factor BamB
VYRFLGSGTACECDLGYNCNEVCPRCCDARVRSGFGESLVFAPRAIVAQTEKWSCFLTGNADSSSPVLGPDGTLYIGSGRRVTVYAIDTVALGARATAARLLEV